MIFGERGGTDETLAIACMGCIGCITAAILPMMMGLQVWAEGLGSFIVAGTLTVIGIRKRVGRGGGKNWFRWAGITAVLATTSALAKLVGVEGRNWDAVLLAGYGIIAGTLTVIGIRKGWNKGERKNWFRWAGITAVLATTSALAMFAGTEGQELDVVFIGTCIAVVMRNRKAAKFIGTCIAVVMRNREAANDAQKGKREQYTSTESPNPAPTSPKASSTAPRTKPVASDANVKLTKKLGSGGFGITWQAYDYVTRKEVAVKIYRPADWAEEGPDGRISLRSEEHRGEYERGLKRFLEEGQLLRTVSHQAVVRVHRHGHGYGSAYLMMELIAGQSLREHLKRTQPARDIQAVRRLMLDLCAGLDAIHRAGIVHRDVKPGNVMLRASGQPVLIDFGSARQRSQDRTRSMTAIVTPGYAPLEQYDRNGHQGPWTDLYALAAMGHEMLLGHRPGDAAGRVANPELAPLDDLERRTGPSRTINAIRCGLAVQAAERPQTCEEMVRLLTEKPGRCEPQEELLPGATRMGRTSIRTSEQSTERVSEARGGTESEYKEISAFPAEAFEEEEMENDWLGLQVIWSADGLAHEYVTQEVVEAACKGNERFVYVNHPLMGELVEVACRNGVDLEEIGTRSWGNVDGERKEYMGAPQEREGYARRRGDIRSYSIIAPLKEDFAQKFHTDPSPKAVLLQGTGAPCDARHSCAILISQEERSKLQGSATHHNVSPMLLEEVVWKSAEGETVSEEDPRTRRLVLEICERGTDLERARDRSGWQVESGRSTDHNGRRRGYSIVADLGACTTIMSNGSAAQAALLWGHGAPIRAGTSSASAAMVILMSRRLAKDLTIAACGFETSVKLIPKRRRRRLTRDSELANELIAMMCREGRDLEEEEACGVNGRSKGKPVDPARGTDAEGRAMRRFSIVSCVKAELARMIDRKAPPEYALLQDIGCPKYALNDVWLISKDDAARLYTEAHRQSCETCIWMPDADVASGLE